MPAPVRTQPGTTYPRRHRLRRLIPDLIPAPVGVTKPPGPAAVGVTLGLLAGFAELAIRVGMRATTGQVTVATLATNHHAWMTPLAGLILLGGLGLVLELVARLDRWPGVGRGCRLAVAVAAAHAVALAIPGLHKVAGLILTLGGGWRLAEAIEAHPGSARRAARWFGAALGLILVGLMVVDLRPQVQASTVAPAGSPNVLWVVLDTVRGDAISPHRSGRDTTPNLARLAEGGVRFDQAQSPSPWTLPAHASLFTGRWAHDHSANVGHALDTSHPTVAEALADRGYATAAFVANTHNGNSWYGLDRGFDHYEDLYENRAVSPFEVLRSSALGWKLVKSRTGRRVLGSVIAIPNLGYRKSAAMVRRDLARWLPTRGDRPFFAFLNLYDAHDPYDPPPGAPHTFAEAGQRANPARPILEKARDDYDDCLHALDAEFGRILADLDSRGLLANTLVVVTSDHGEAFGEHGLQGHGISLYRSELHVPLILSHPGRLPAGRVVETPVSTRDLAATVADHLGVSAPFPGISLARFWSGTARPEPILGAVSRAVKLSKLATNAPARVGPMFTLIDGGLKLIRNGDGRLELYDLRADPAEQTDLAASPGSAADLARMRDRLETSTAATH